MQDHIIEPQFEIDPKLLNNEAEFTEPFYKRFKLRHASAPLELTNGIKKDYLFPTLYKNVVCSMGIFFCDYDAAKKALPDPKLEPVRMTMGRSLVTFSCYYYETVLGVKAYNEIAMTIPVMVNPKWNVPVLPMILPIFKNFGFHVFHMPVTSLENQIRGNKIWGLPKVTQRIDILFRNEMCKTIAYEKEGMPYFELNVPTDGKTQHFDVSAHLYSKLEGKLLQSKTSFQSDFKVNKFPKLLWKKDLNPNKEYLKIGDSPSGQMLKKLKIDPHPFQLRFSNSMQSAYDLANPHYSGTSS